MPPFEEFVEGLKQIWGSHILTNYGPLHKELVSRLGQYLQVDHLSLFVNGHQALEIAIKALDLQGEVITTPFTFASTTHALVRNKITPVFCDINSYDYTIDVTEIESLITDKTSAIIPVHVYGNPCDVEAIDKIATKHHLKVIYDAAHTFGVQVNGRGIGSYGDVSMFSFHATKVFNTIEGGALSYADPEIESRLYLESNFGIAGPDDVLLPGTNAKMNEFQALMGISCLPYVDEEISKRKLVVEKYCQLLSGVPGIRVISPEKPRVRSNFAYLPIVIDETVYGMNRNMLYDLLKSHEIYARKYFYPLVSNYKCYQGKFVGDLPVANYIADRVITLPLWGGLAEEIVEEICQIIAYHY
jgi:dTDP-4-amino-4,6-dideoxygalactose transaminase